MKTVRFAVVGLVGLAVGLGLGRLTDSPSREKPTREKSYEAKSRIADRGESATVASLRARIARLEQALAKRAEREETAVTNGAAAKDGFGRPHGNPRQFLDELREKDPARYAQITNRMARWQARRAAMAHSRMEYLASIDVSHMGAGAKKVHGELQDLLAQREEIERQLQNPDLSESDRKSLFDQLHETRGKLNQLNRQERNNLLAETAKELGFKGDDVKAITATIQDVIEATSTGRGGPPLGGEQGGAGGPPPGGGPGGPM